jgi:hypothetical protein
VQLDEKKKPISTRLGDAFDSGELEDRIKSMSGPARKSFMNLANSLTDFYHSMGDIHQVDGRQLEDKIDGSPPRVRKMFAKLLDEDVQLDETMTARDLESMIKGLKKGAKQEIADVLNDMNLSGYGDYEARADNVHKFKTKDLFKAMKKVMRLESFKMSLDEKQKMTYVIDRSTKKVVHGPTDTGDAKLYVKKQIQPRKFMIRDIRGAAKKVGDTV